jgi:hypothetical protein
MKLSMKSPSGLSKSKIRTNEFTDYKIPEPKLLEPSIMFTTRRSTSPFNSKSCLTEKPSHLAIYNYSIGHYQDIT